jgi:hypothetical protein
LSFTATAISSSEPEIAFGRLYRGVAEQEFDLLQIPAILPEEFRAGAAEVVGAKMFDSDLLR